MNISRMDDDSIRCILTSEDLEENGLKMEDFLQNSEHAREFLQTIVERAREEVGYEFEGGALAMQVMPLPQNGLLVTFSEKTDSFLKGLSEHLKDLFQMGGDSELTDFMEKNASGKDQAKTVENLLRSIIGNRLEKSLKAAEENNIKETKKKTIAEKKTPAKLPEILMYRFETLERIEKFCMVAETGRFMKSQIFYQPENKQWFLIIWRGRTSEKLFRKFCAQALEYGILVSDNENQMAYLMEHGECILEKDAVNQLKLLG